MMLPRVNLIRTGETDYLMFSTGDAISATVYTNGYWAKPITDISLTFCTGIDSPLVLDVGANLGTYAIPLAQKLAASGGTVFAFEPQRIVYYQLCGNVFLNRLDNVHPFHAAVGNADGTVRIPNVDYGVSPNIGGFSIDATESRHNSIAESDGSYDVRMTKLDSLAFPTAPSLIKIDVEGGELDVLKGAGRMISEANCPPLMLEAWTSAPYSIQRDTLLSYLNGLGYAYFLIGEEIIAQHPNHQRQFEFGINAAGGLHMTRVR